MQQEHKYMPLIISLVAGLVVSIITIINRYNSITAILIILGVLLGFYILGLIFRAILRATATKEEDVPAEDGEESEAEAEMPDVTTNDRE